MAKKGATAVAAKGKEQLKRVENKAISKKQKKAEEVVVKQEKEIVESKKKNQKPPKVLAPPKKIKKEVSEEEDEESDSGADLEEEPLVDNEAEEDDDVDDDEDDDDDEDEDEDEADEDDEEETVVVKQEKSSDDDESDDDDAPTEEAIGKKQGGIPKIKTNPLPKDFPCDQTVLVKSLPKNVKLLDIFEVFSRFGDIVTIHTTHGPVVSSATIGYTTPEAAQKAIAIERPTKIKGLTIKVFPKIDKKKPTDDADKSIMVRGIKIGTTVDEIKNHFAVCGNVARVTIFKTINEVTKAIVTFEDKASVPKSKELSMSLLNGSSISIMLKDQNYRDPERTVIVKNTNPSVSVSLQTLQKIFADCGELDNIHVLQSKKILAFVLFKEPKGVTKALKLSGSVRENVALDLQPYAPIQNTKVFVSNLKDGTTEKQIRDLFSSCGEIESILMKPASAIVCYSNVEGFCKSFTLNESYLNGKLVFLEPFSSKKVALLQKSSAHKRKFLSNKPPQRVGGNKPPFKKFKSA